MIFLVHIRAQSRHIALISKICAPVASVSNAFIAKTITYFGINLKEAFVHGKNNFAQVFKNLGRSENNFIVEPSK